MPIIREQILRFRVFDGIDLNVDARTVNPRAWKKLENYYPKTRGRLVKRPGSTEFTSGTVKFDTHVDDLMVLDPLIKIFTPGSEIVERIVRGIRGLHATPRIDADQDTIFGALSWTAPVLFVETGDAVLGLHDVLFYVDSANDIIVMETLDGTVDAGGQLWHFLDWPRSGSDSDSFVTGNVGLAQSTADEQVGTRTFTRADGSTVSGGLMLATNRVDPLIGIWQSDTNSAPKAGPLQVLRGDDRFYMYKVQHMIKYAGSIVLGGAQLRGPLGAITTGAIGVFEDDLRNFVFFLDIDDYDQIGAAASLQIGDTPESDPITALGIVSVQTDSMGLRGQLAVFTANKVEVFDGPPPQSGIPISAEFRNSMNHPAGCSSPNTVKATSAGLMYLGTDGNVYLIRPSDRPRPVGRAIEPALRGLTTEQLLFASAVFDEGFYKLAVPRVGSGTNADDQYWADIRNIQFDEYDLGVNWTGTHKGQQAGTFITLTGFRDAREVLMGSNRIGKIFRVTDETVRTDDGVDIRALAESPEMDGGDAHIDKDFIGLELGLSTDKLNTTVDIVVSSMSDQNCISQAAQFTEAVDPCGPTWGNFNYNQPSAAGAVFYSATEAFELVRKRPSARLRGSMFKVTIIEDSNAKTSISDFGLRLRSIRRRGT